MYQVLNELYFGKPANMLKFEDYITKLKLKYRGENVYSSNVFQELLKDSILKQMGQLLEQEFGFTEVIVTFHNSKAVNASTLGMIVGRNGGVYDLSDKEISRNRAEGSIIVTNNGIRFDPRKITTRLIVCFWTGLVFGKELTNEEIVAILLHEVGHNFSKLTMSLGMDDRSDEKFADQFVAMYGYSNEFIKGLHKTVFNKTRWSGTMDIPIINVALTAMLIGSNWLSTKFIGDEHPTNIRRFESQVKQLESDLKYTPNLTPAMRRDIQRQIDVANATIENIKARKDPSQNMAEKMYKYYYTEWEPNINEEKDRDAYSEKYSNPDEINKSLLKKRKNNKR